ncbi:MAG: hypothetical protein ACKOXG_12570 [Arenimonas sp.]
MENEACACGLFSVCMTENFAQFRVFPGSGMRRRQNFPSAAPPSRHASGLPDSGSRFSGTARACFRSTLQPFVFKASSASEKNLRPLRCDAADHLHRPAGKRPRRAAFFFNKSVDIAKTLDLAFTCVPRESSRVIKTSSTIQANAIDCLPAIEKSSSPAKTVSESKRSARLLHGTRLRKASGVFFSAGTPAVLPGVLPGHCSTWAL